MSKGQLRLNRDDIQNVLDQIKKDVEESPFSLFKPFLSKAQIEEINSITLTTVDLKEIKCDESIHKIEDKDYITKKINEDYKEKLFLENQKNYFSLLKDITHCLAQFKKQAFELQLYESERSTEDGLSRSYEEIKNSGRIDELKNQAQIYKVVTREQSFREATNYKRARKKIENIFIAFPSLIDDYEYLRLMNTMKSIFEKWFEYYDFNIPIESQEIKKEKSANSEQVIFEPLENNYTVVRHRGKRYEFTFPQARAVKFLHEFIGDGRTHVHQKDVLKKLYTKQRYLRDIFRDKKYHKNIHPAWGTLIKRVSNNIYTLDLF